jgi:pyruvate dehydrogenase E2 component (dihydrolipoamide acetyltransferase)
MSDFIPIKVPDLGDIDDAEIIEILIMVGDSIQKDSPLITLETDKATMDIPSLYTGTVKKIHVHVGDTLSKGDVIIDILPLSNGSKAEVSNEKKAIHQKEESNAIVSSSEKKKEHKEQKNEIKKSNEGMSELKIIYVPDIGDASNVEIIEILIAKGDQVKKDQGLIVLETDKATMEVPSNDKGEVIELLVAVGDKVSQGDKIAQIKNDLTKSITLPKKLNSPQKPPSLTPFIEEEEKVLVGTEKYKTAPVPEHPYMKKKKVAQFIHASPSVRRFARELGADLSQINGTGLKARIIKEDVQEFIKFELSKPKEMATSSLSTKMPKIDHHQWGDVEELPLTRIQKISSVNLQQYWNLIPHVTQHEDADITELDAFRKSMKDEALSKGVRLTPLAFIMKALVHSLKAFPKFNSSLSHDNKHLCLKKYYHIGVAVETPDGLTVPIIRDVDKKGIYQLAMELNEMSAKARAKKLTPKEMQGSSFTISSLGGIGGTAFTPIVKWPDVAILGLSRHKNQPVWNGQSFEPRLMLPMSLSYDHRVIDGADAARFVVHLASTLHDIRRILLN